MDQRLSTSLVQKIPQLTHLANFPWFIHKMTYMSCTKNTQNRKKEIYARAQFIPDECPLEIELTVQELSSCTETLKEYVQYSESAYKYSLLYDDEDVLFKNKVYIPITLRNRILNWYRLYLCHPGGTRLGKTIQQSCDWPGLIAQADLISKQYTTCHKFKKAGKPKYR